MIDAIRTATCLLAAMLWLPAAHAQAAATATASTRIQVFGGLSGNYTGLGLGRNADITAGIDIGFGPFAGFYPMLEGRGMYPVAKGQLDNQENLVGGLRLGRRKNRFSGYGDALFGRGRIDYPNGFPVPGGRFLLDSNTSNVLSFGGGVDFMATSHFGLKGDFQMQRYDSPATTSGTLYSKVFTAGLIYRVGFGGRIR